MACGINEVVPSIINCKENARFSDGMQKGLATRVSFHSGCDGSKRDISVMSSLAKTPRSLLKRTNRAQEVNLAECRPVHVREVKLAVDALPKQKSG
jgi:hypothetical protein